MTMLPPENSGKKLGLVIDLDTCVGCHACAVNCKEWNTGGHSAPLPDDNPFGADASGVWFNRVHSYECGDGPTGRTVNFPRSCLHCENAACVEVCPTGASYKRAEDGIVLVNEDICIGCKLCSWACPYGAREYDHDAGVMKKCTLCIDRIYNENLDEEDRERGGVSLMEELGYQPVNQYLPPRPRRAGDGDGPKALPPSRPPSPLPMGDQAPAGGAAGDGLFRWIDRILSR